MGLCWRHLTSAERAVVFAEARRGASQREIARLLGRSASMVCREVRRGRGPAGAIARSGARRSMRGGVGAAGLGGSSHRAGRFGGWCAGSSCRSAGHPKGLGSQIAARRARMPPDDPALRVSHETIYAAIHAQPRGGLKAAMTLALRQGKPKRRIRRRTLAGSAIVPDSLKIMYRPEEVAAAPRSLGG